MAGLKELLKKGIGEMSFNSGGGAINWYPGHMAAATRAIRHRLKLSDLVIEIPQGFWFQVSSISDIETGLKLALAELDGNVEDENDLENLIDQQFGALQKALKIPHKASEARLNG